MCDYQGHEFGANYLDSVCIDGQLWDADDCDEHGYLYEPMDFKPCPECNHDLWVEQHEDEIMDMGYLAAYEGEPKVPPFTYENIRYPVDVHIFNAFWIQGYEQCEEECPA